MNCDRKILFNELANHHDNEGSNILHNAAAHAAASDDIQFFTRLLDHGVQMYVEDNKGRLAAFLITRIKNDSTFLMAYKSLLKSGFDFDYSDSDDTSFL